MECGLQTTGLRGPQLPVCPTTELHGSWLAGRPPVPWTVGRAARSVAGGRPSVAPLDGPQPQPPAERCTEGMSGGKTLSFNLCTCETGGASWSVPMCGSVRMRHGAGLARAGVCRRQHVREHGMPGRWWRGALKGPPRSVAGAHGTWPRGCARRCLRRSKGRQSVLCTERGGTSGGSVARVEGCRLWQGGEQSSLESRWRAVIWPSARRRSALTRCGAAFSGLGAQCARPAATWHA